MCPSWKRLEETGVHDWKKITECDLCIHDVRQAEPDLAHIVGDPEDHLGWCCTVCANGGASVQSGGVGHDFRVECMGTVPHAAMEKALSRAGHLQAMQWA